MTDTGKSVLRHPVPWLLAVALVGAVLWKWLGSPAAKPPTPPPAPVVVGLVEQRDVPRWLSGIGTAQSLHSVTLRPQVDGVLNEVLFREGQFVTEGQLLARIDDRSILAELRQAQAEQARNQAQLKAAELDLTRYRNLLKDEAVSRQTLEQQLALVDELKATVQANAASIAVTEVQLSHTRITSPVSGRVGLRRVDPGNLVRISDVNGLTTVTQIDPIAVVFALPQQDLPKVRALLVENADNVPVIAFDRDQAAPLAQGRLSMIDNAIDGASGTLRLKAEFNNTDGRLWPGQFVSVQLLAETYLQVLVVDSSAVKQGLDGSYALRIEDGKAQMVPVQIGYRDDAITVISQGLSAGDQVIVDGHSRVIPGAAVNVIDTRPTPLRATDAALADATPTASSLANEGR
ncbi:MAG TPA: efflux RND transporter periplasmic adaptor subunit [Dongiaceae bacterium]|nr:efflux RND transporter periplasmic adaptor subunit [Dongiaceae bacterium]